MAMTKREAIVVEYADLAAGAAGVQEKVAEAFGEQGLGLIAVRGVPDLDAVRERVLQASYAFAKLPEAVQKAYEVPPFFQRGWDHGHEAMKDGTPDRGKGSFYFNPTRDSFEDFGDEVRQAYPTFFGQNVFPSEVPDFEPAVRKVSRIILDVGTHIAAICDRIVAAAHPDAQADRFVNTIKESDHHACRVLHYFARAPGAPGTVSAAEASADGEGKDVDDSWCGWHNDHGTLTGLLPAGYHDDATGALVPNPDPRAGLYIKTRQGETVHVRGPGGSGCLFFQIGETAQIHSGGVLRATPHMVQSVRVPGISRSTMALFTGPRHTYPMDMPPKANEADALRCEHLPPGVPLLASRWEHGIHFGDFSNKTFKSYYKGSSK